MKMPGSKPSIAVLIAEKASKKKEKPENNKYAEMADEILQAIKDNNAKALGSYLKSFVSACENDYEEDIEE